MNYTHYVPSDHCRNFESILSQVRNKRTIGKGEDTFTKVMNYRTSKSSKNVDDSDDISLSSVTSDIFSENDNHCSTISDMDEDVFTEDHNDRSIFAVDESIFDKTNDKNSAMLERHISLSSGSLPLLIKSQDFEISSFKPRNISKNSIVTPDSQHLYNEIKTQYTTEPFLCSKTKFDELLAKLELAMKRTEVTRSEVLKYTHLCNGHTNIS